MFTVIKQQTYNFISHFFCGELVGYLADCERSLLCLTVKGGELSWSPCASQPSSCRQVEAPGGAASQSFITPSHRWRPSSQAARRRERFSLRVIFTTTSRCCVLDVSINNKLPGGTNEIAFQPCFPYLGWSFVHEAHVRVSLRNQEETKTWRKSWNCSTKVLLRC